MYKKALIVAVSLALSGCGMARQFQQAEQTKELRAQAKAATDDCNAKFPLGNPKIEVARVQCLNSAFAILMPTFGPDQDLAQVFMADRLVIAEQIQSGKLDIAEGNAQIASKWSEVVSESQNRQMARQSVAAQQDVASAQRAQAFAASLAAINAATPRPAPAPMIIQQPSTVRLQTSCNTFGTITTCN
jgi:hypothetical protein